MVYAWHLWPFTTWFILTIFANSAIFVRVIRSYFEDLLLIIVQKNEKWEMCRDE